MCEARPKLCFYASRPPAAHNPPRLLPPEDGKKHTHEGERSNPRQPVKGKSNVMATKYTPSTAGWIVQLVYDEKNEKNEKTCISNTAEGSTHTHKSTYTHTHTHVVRCRYSILQSVAVIRITHTVHAITPPPPPHPSHPLVIFTCASLNALQQYSRTSRTAKLLKALLQQYVLDV